MTDKIQICVIWQSLVVDAYRRFFYLLESNSKLSVHLIAPEYFEELGTQRVSCTPFLKDKANHSILPVLSPHTQIVWFRGLTEVLNAQKAKSKFPLVILCFGEPYSPTSLGVWIAARRALGADF